MRRHSSHPALHRDHHAGLYGADAIGVTPIHTKKSKRADYTFARAADAPAAPRHVYALIDSRGYRET